MQSNIITSVLASWDAVQYVGDIKYAFCTSTANCNQLMLVPTRPFPKSIRKYWSVHPNHKNIYIYINNLFVVKTVQWFSDLCFEQYHGKYSVFTSIVLGWHENISNLGTWNLNSCICKAPLMERVLTMWKWNGHNSTDLYRKKKGLIKWKWNGKKVKQCPAGQLHSYLYKTGDPLY